MHEQTNIQIVRIGQRRDDHSLLRAELKLFKLYHSKYLSL